MTNSEKLLKMKTKIDEAKNELSKLEGKQEQLIDSLNKDFDCKTIEDAEQKLRKTEIELDKKEKELNNGLLELEKKYNWEI